MLPTGRYFQVQLVPIIVVMAVKFQILEEAKLKVATGQLYGRIVPLGFIAFGSP